MQSGFDAFSLAPGIFSCGVLLFKVHDDFVQIKLWFTLANNRLAGGLYESHMQLNSLFGASSFLKREALFCLLRRVRGGMIEDGAALRLFMATMQTVHARVFTEGTETETDLIQMGMDLYFI